MTGFYLEPYTLDQYICIFLYNLVNTEVQIQDPLFTEVTVAH